MNTTQPWPREVPLSLGRGVGERGNLPLRFMVRGSLPSPPGFSILIALLLVLTSLPCAGQKSELKRPPPLSPEEGKRQARQLVDNLLRIRPEENMTETLLFKIIDANDKETQVPVRFDIVSTPTNFVNTYSTLGSGSSAPTMKLTIIHTENQANRYWLSHPVDSKPRRLTADELSLSFANSDFWAADLGLEFLQWPEQRVIRNEMRRYVFCQVLESVNPHPTPGSYSRIVSWIGANRPEELVLVHADAYDARGKLLKQFDPRKLEKIHGVQELEEMEIRNRQTGSRTKVEFNLEQRQAGR
jgi:Outer membrane lipoprotein-sorting protein